MTIKPLIFDSQEGGGDETGQFGNSHAPAIGRPAHANDGAGRVHEGDAALAIERPERFGVGNPRQANKNAHRKGQHANRADGPAQRGDGRQRPAAALCCQSAAAAQCADNKIAQPASGFRDHEAKFSLQRLGFPIACARPTGCGMAAAL